MPEHDDIKQPQRVSKALDNYLEMTTPRRDTPPRRPRRRNEQVREPRPPIDNRGLSLEDGNDFA
jgi:hypothetical protein